MRARRDCAGTSALRCGATFGGMSPSYQFARVDAPCACVGIVAYEKQRAFVCQIARGVCAGCALSFGLTGILPRLFGRAPAQRPAWPPDRGSSPVLFWQKFRRAEKNRAVRAVTVMVLHSAEGKKPSNKLPEVPRHTPAGASGATHKMLHQGQQEAVPLHRPPVVGERSAGIAPRPPTERKAAEARRMDAGAPHPVGLAPGPALRFFTGGTCSL